ncbi:hypothetical protein SAMN05444144_11163 [Flavobacterium akiainvivens]|nr:hypothetical protein SAMN05444144_11163 [Flavobacterium akiainvivens]
MLPSAPKAPETAHKETVFHQDTIYKLLETAKAIDTLEFDGADFEKEIPEFGYIKTGRFLSDDKDAVLISLDDDNYKVELYTLQNSNWVKKDEISGLEAGVIQFYTRYADFDFDGHKDIYIQYACSNGLAFSYGHLLTINPKTKKLTYHKEAFDLASIEPNPKTKTVISLDIRDCLMEHDTCQIKNVWKNGRLKTLPKDCGCE